MQRINWSLRFFPCVLIALLVLAGVDLTQASASERLCVVQETLNDGNYTYIRCREGSNDVWVSTLKLSVSAGEQISFTDAPPMVNFKSKLRTFPLVIFTSVTKKGESRSNFEAAKKRNNTEQENPFRVDDESTFTGTDENGTIVFSDNPAKVPNRRIAAHDVNFANERSGRIVKNLTNPTKLKASEKKLLPILQRALSSYCAYDTRALQSITFPAYWSKLKQDIEKEGDTKSEQFFRLFCFKEFKAEAAQSFDSRCNYDNKIYSTTNIGLSGIQADSEEEIGCTASFVKVKNVWKYIDIVCGAGIGYPPGFREP